MLDAWTSETLVRLADSRSAAVAAAGESVTAGRVVGGAQADRQRHGQQVDLYAGALVVAPEAAEQGGQEGVVHRPSGRPAGRLQVGEGHLVHHKAAAVPVIALQQR